jgi:hypothetical protein
MSSGTQNPPRREGHDSSDWIDRLASDIRDLNPDYHDFEAEVARMIRVAFRDAFASWQAAALRVGEELSTVGPNGYYGLTPEQWREWALSAIRKQT